MVEELKEPEVPEIKKMEAVKDKSQAIGEFLEWLYEEGLLVAKYSGSNDRIIPVSILVEKLLANYFNIDLNKVESEKRALLEYVRRVQDATEVHKNDGPGSEAGNSAL